MNKFSITDRTKNTGQAEHILVCENRLIIHGDHQESESIPKAIKGAHELLISSQRKQVVLIVKENDLQLNHWP